jgi:pimeloyl-ACP methyl ester carboxylesterase
MLPLKWRLERRGVGPVHVASLSPLCIQDVRHLAADLARSVAEVRRATGADKVDLVGVSQGGLVALAYLHLEGGAAVVDRFVAMGTPFSGTWFGLLGAPTLGAISPGLWQTLPSSAFLKELRDRGVPDGVTATSVAIPGDPVSPPEACRLPGAAFRLTRPTRSPLVHQALILSGACADVAAEALRAGR